MSKSRIRAHFSLRNLPQPVDLYEVVLSGCAREYAIDPVCKMQVDKRHAAGDLHFDKRTYWFCSLVVRRAVCPAACFIRSIEAKQSDATRRSQPAATSSSTCAA